MGTTSRLHRRRMGELLVSEGMISNDQLEDALAVQRESGELLGTILLDMGLIGETEITTTLCAQYQLPFLSLANYEVDPKLVQIFTPEYLHRHTILPFDQMGKTLLLVVGEIPDPEVLEEVPRRTNLNAALYVGYLSEVSQMLQELAPPPDAAKLSAGAKQKAAAAAAAPAPASPKAAAASKAAAKPDRAQKHTLEIVPGAHDDGEETDQALIFGENSETFLEELDTTWDSIFQESSAGEEDEAEAEEEGETSGPAS